MFSWASSLHCECYRLNWVYWSFVGSFQHRKSIKQLLCAKIIIIIFHETTWYRRYRSLSTNPPNYYISRSRSHSRTVYLSLCVFFSRTIHICIVKNLNPPKTFRLFDHLCLLPTRTILSFRLPDSGWFRMCLAI